MGTVSHMTEAECLKVNLPMLVNLWSVEIKLGRISGVIGVDSAVVVGRRRPCLAGSYKIILLQ